MSVLQGLDVYIENSHVANPFLLAPTASWSEFTSNNEKNLALRELI